MEPSALRVLIADDSELFGDTLEDVLVEDFGIEVVGRAGDGLDALKLVKVHEPHVAIIDLRMPRLDGGQVAREIEDVGLSTKVVILTMDSGVARERAL